MKKNKTLIILLLAVIVGIIAYVAYNNNGKENETGNQETTSLKEITIGYPYLRIALPVLVAKENGYFEEEGLNVKLHPYETAQPMMDAIVSGKIDLGGFCALPITFGAMARSKTDLLFIGGMFEDDTHPISVLIVKDTVKIKSIKDLKGKKIGILPTRAYEVWIQDILQANGVNPNDVIISQVKPNLQADALNNGSIDALFTNDPAATITMTKYKFSNFTKKALVPEVTKMYPFYFGSFNIRKDFAKKNPEILQKVTKALDKAMKFINDNPDAKLVMAKKDYLPKPFRPIVKNFPNSLFRLSSEVTDDDLNEIKNFYLKKQILPVDINVKGLQYHNE